MPLDHAGKYFANPRMMGHGAPEPEGEGMTEHGGGGKAHAIHVHKKTEGGFHVVTHHASGSSPSHHDNLESVHSHMQEHFGADHEPGSDGLGDDGDVDDSQQPSKRQVKFADNGAY